MQKHGGIQMPGITPVKAQAARNDPGFNSHSGAIAHSFSMLAPVKMAPGDLRRLHWRCVMRGTGHSSRRGISHLRHGGPFHVSKGKRMTIELLLDRTPPRLQTGMSVHELVADVSLAEGGGRHRPQPTLRCRALGACKA
jgi:hypothetical protein